MNRSGIKIVVGAVLSLWLAVPAAIMLFFWFNSEKAGQVGEAFGAINALFTGLGLAGVCIILITEIQSNKEAKAATQAQINALSQQMMAMRAAAMLATTTRLLEAEYRHINAYHRKWIPDEIETLTDSGLVDLLEHLKRPTPNPGRGRECLIENVECLIRYRTKIKELYEELDRPGTWTPEDHVSA